MMQKRIYALDLVKFIAAFFVVCIHTKTTSKLDNFEQGSFSFIIDNIARFAVPFFFITSGYLLDFNDRGKLFKRLGALFLLYLFWAAVFICIRYFNDFPYRTFSFTGNSMLNSAANVFYKLFFYGYELHLWFFPAYIIAAGMVYFLQKHLPVLLLLAVLLYMLGLTGQQFSFIYPPRIDQLLHDTYFTRNGIFFGFPCMATGYYIRRKQWRIPMLVTIIAVVLFFVLQYTECVFVMDHFNPRIGDYYLCTLPLAASILLLCLNMPDAGSDLGKITRLAGGIYLLHPLFMYTSLLVFPELMKEAWWPYAYTPLLFMLSVSLAYIAGMNGTTKKLVAV